MIVDLEMIQIAKVNVHNQNLMNVFFKKRLVNIVNYV